MNKKVMLLIPILIGIMFVLPMISAATTLTSPVANGNYSTTMTLTATTAINASGNSYNVTFYYNASGGATGTKLVTVTNTSAAQSTFTSASYGITGLADGALYNFSAYADNGTDQQWSASVRPVIIDDTASTGTVTLSSDRVSPKGEVAVTWTSSDATSGVNTVSTTVTSQNSDRCPVITYTDTAATKYLRDEQTLCEGEYTVSSLITDYSGNTVTTTKTFKVVASGLTKSGSSTLGGNQKSQFTQGSEINANLPLGETGTNIAILIVLGAAAYLFFKRKN